MSSYRDWHPGVAATLSVTNPERPLCAWDDDLGGAGIEIRVVFVPHSNGFGQPQPAFSVTKSRQDLHLLIRCHQFQDYLNRVISSVRVSYVAAQKLQESRPAISLYVGGSQAFRSPAVATRFYPMAHRPCSPSTDYHPFPQPPGTNQRYGPRCFSYL